MANDERAKYDLLFEKTLLKVCDLARGKKTDDYGETWKRLGLKGIYLKLFIKEGRLNELVWKKNSSGVASKDESIEDTLMDMIAYATYGIIALQENNIYGEESTKEFLKTMQKALENTIDRINNLY
jgi:hypothetical protein